MGAKEGESIAGRVWAVGFHHVTARSHSARVYEMLISLIFNYLCVWGAVNRR
jgi:hypothetical protein